MLFLNQEWLYEAANEFEWVRKLMPGQPDPRVNQALALGTAGRTGGALASYASALEVWPMGVASDARSSTGKIRN